ncbi:LuxR C-terminal-related transcriptional regulator [Sphingomonas sp. IC-56]|uniref:response regulator transcription factor n=1 Tax=Sphingomonas sp. IC-56 TaxID=2898529 RepID=UPI001E3EB2AB|nr:LuxR C-terminal-related transcriptional regulator [Sphingomonas sp. IC-56]MCD2324414.1 LuxR C-terminal-related transcriptional regulator [Sphingomonas sp. IC-56]
MQVHVVDEEIASRRSLGLILQRLGHRVRFFVSGHALVTAQDVEPGCVLLDLCTSDLAALDVLNELSDRRDTLPAIIIARLDDFGTAVSAMKMGAIDVLAKPVQPNELATSIELAESTLQRASRRQDLAKRAETRLQRLTRREREVLAGVARGQTNKTIGVDLGISPRTVEIHRAHLTEKLDVHNLSELLRLVYESELGDDDAAA